MVRLKKHFMNKDLAEAALLGLQLRKEQLDNQILEVRSRLSRGDGYRAGPWAARKNSKRISVAGRRRIAAAQKRRWAEYRKSADKS